VVPSASIDAGLGYSDGMIKLGEDMVLIPNLTNIIEQNVPRESLVH
jgi:hypothetical protein